MSIRRTLIILSIAAAAAALAEGRPGPNERPFSDRDLRGTWTFKAQVEATLLVPFPAETTHSTPPSVLLVPGDKVTVTGTAIGLFKFDGRGRIETFQNLFKVGGLETTPPFPLPYLPPSPEEGSGSYAVEADGRTALSTTIVDPASGVTVGEAEYDCVLNRAPRRLDCMFSRFTTYVVDPGGFEAPIVGLAELRPRR